MKVTTKQQRKTSKKWEVYIYKLRAPEKNHRRNAQNWVRKRGRIKPGGSGSWGSSLREEIPGISHAGGEKQTHPPHYFLEKVKGWPLVSLHYHFK